jgi:UDP-N-acetylglucosamine 2-epimerase
MLTGIETVLQRERPDWVLVYGDTNSTLAGALAAAKLHIPVAHVESGLRSFNRHMPEEINRVVTDHLSARLFCPSAVSQRHLATEGIVDGVHVVGDVMADALLSASAQADASAVLGRYGLVPRGYFLATIHRAENTDNPARLAAILRAFGVIQRPILLPLHPRTGKAIEQNGLTIPSNVRQTGPLGYLDLVRAMRDADAVMTDSGGLQKEAYWLGTPCVTLRDETEWVETVENGWNRLVGADTEVIVAAVSFPFRPAVRPPLYGGDGRAAERIQDLL